ncbi:MAG: hypothetical protein RHS_0350 [Robinsoniella sp. RHS]|nr:MAG: hypothetical protein RHS_0350 [Robinsoniella sp. RHS]
MFYYKDVQNIRGIHVTNDKFIKHKRPLILIDMQSTNDKNTKDEKIR